MPELNSEICGSAVLALREERFTFTQKNWIITKWAQPERELVKVIVLYFFSAAMTCCSSVKYKDQKLKIVCFEMVTGKQ